MKYSLLNPLEIGTIIFYSTVLWNKIIGDAGHGHLEGLHFKGDKFNKLILNTPTLY